jgi:hypothetical protein
MIGLGLGTSKDDPSLHTTRHGSPAFGPEELRVLQSSLEV